MEMSGEAVLNGILSQARQSNSSSAVTSDALHTSQPTFSSSSLGGLLALGEHLFSTLKNGTEEENAIGEVIRTRIGTCLPRFE